MKTISPALQAHLNGELTTLAELVKITRADGTTIGLTSHDADVVFDGITYKADGAFSPQTMTNAASLKEKESEMTGLLDSVLISETDLKAGLYDHARVDVYIVNWTDLSQGTVHMRRGWLGEVTVEGGKYVAELRGLRDLLKRPVGETYTPECRYDLGDGRCGVNVAALTVTGSVTSVTDESTFSDTSRAESDDAFNYGKLTWTSGANAGLSMEVKDWNAATHTFTLWLPMPNAIAVSDAYAVYPGCNKRFATCSGVFSNVANFGGFPHLPGVSKLLQYPDG